MKSAAKRGEREDKLTRVYAFFFVFKIFLDLDLIEMREK